MDSTSGPYTTFPAQCSNNRLVYRRELRIKQNHIQNPLYGNTLEPLEPRLLLSASSPFELAGLTNEDGGAGSAGFLLDIDDHSFINVSNAGDINGDGFDDLMVAQSYSWGWNGEQGKVHVIFGKPGGPKTPVDFDRLDGRNGFTVTGGYYDYAGASLSAAGDINGDGFDDIIIGARGGYNYLYYLGEEFGAGGSAYVVFGHAGRFDADISVGAYSSKSSDKAIGFSIEPVGRYHYVLDVSGAGDINGDGFDDVVLASNTDSYVVFGKAGGFDTRLKVDDLDGTNGFTITDSAAGRLGVSTLTVAGDINRDGFDDLLLGNYVIYGKASGFTDRFDVTTLNAANGFVIQGAEGRRISMSGAGDINGDGFEDLIIGNYQSDPDGNGSVGASYVVFGRRRGFGAALDLTTLDGTHGFAIYGLDVGDRLGGSVTGAGDVNNDGYDDLLIGAPGADPNGITDAGTAYLIFGGPGPFSANLDLTTLDGNDGFAIYGVKPHDSIGGLVSAAGDMNGDGYDDIALKASGPTSTAYRREVYVIYGGRDIRSPAVSGTPGNDVLIGTPASDRFIGGAGDDTLIGNGGADSLRGEAGDDLLAVSDLDFNLLSGGEGIDTLRLDGAGLFLALNTSRGDRITSIDVIDLTGSGDNTLILDEASVYKVTDYGDPLVILGDAGDAIYLGAGWTLTGNEVIGDDVFNVYEQYDAIVKVADTILILPDPIPAIDGDFTGDGKADILWRDTRDGSNIVWQFDDTTFELEARLRSLPNTDWKIVGTGDFTGDGKNDILWRNTKDGRNRVWEMDGTDFVQRIDIKTLSSKDWQVAGVGDFNGDGRDDILWRNTNNGLNVAWNMFGTEFLKSASLKRLANQDWQAATVGDLTGDGKDDILWRNRSTGQNTVWEMQGAYLKHTHKIKRIKNPAWQIAGIADYTGDGVSDILWRHTTKGLNSVWEMNNTAFRVGIPLPSLSDLWQQPASPLLGLWEA